MKHTLSIVAVLAGLMAMPAYAVGERIIVTGASEAQLKETLCISMECVSQGQAKASGYSAMIESKATKTGVEIRVLGADGKVRTSQKVPMGDSGRLSSTDLVSATSEIMTAIEDPNHRAKAEEKTEKAPAKSKKVAKKHPMKGIRLASRAHASRG